MTIRKIEPLTRAQLGKIVPGGADTPEPKFIRARPLDLLVDDTYQRGLSERGRGLIRRLVEAWDWRSFTPPVVVRVGGGLHVIDGQHTAIAAGSHPDIRDLPVMLVDAEAVRVRAMTFLTRNRNRIAVSQCQMHIAAVAAGDEDAMTVDQVCRRAKIKILGFNPGFEAFEPGDTMAISTLRTLVGRRGARPARLVLDELYAAELAPVSAGFIKAAEEVMCGEHAALFKPGVLGRLILRATSDELERSAAARVRAKGGALWKSLVVSIVNVAKR